MFKKIAITFALALTTQFSWSGMTHYNQLILHKETSQNLRLEFTVNPSQLLHQWLAPALPFAAFLQQYAALPEDTLRRELTKAIKKFEGECFVVQSSGTKRAIKLSDFPSAADLKLILQRHLLILDLPGNLQAHMEPIVLKASLGSRSPLHRVQLYVSPAVFPIQVQYQQDVLWLTSQIPMALYDF
jgi:hypothetical protein